MMNKRMYMAMLCGMVSAMIAQGYSNPIEGGSTEVVTNAYQVQLPWYMVGGNSEGNSLVVTDGGSVGNQIGYIGNAAGSSNNSATVTGVGSVWNSSMELSIGRDGSGNQLTIANGGRVDTANGYVGSNSVNNAVHVRDPGSLLNATTLHVGLLGSDNSLNISDGGRVETADGTIGYWIGADGNTLTVQGAGSVLHSTGAINVGSYGSGNQLLIDTGGRAESPVVNLGVQSISSNNTITVTGSGSMLDAPEIHIGGSVDGAGGTGNRIEVQNGGTVATTDLNIYAGNQFDLNNGGTLAVNTNFNAAMSGFNFNSGGTLEVGGELTGMGSEIEGQRTVVMNGSNAMWNKVGSTLYVGRDTSGNSFVVANGGRAEDRIGYIGYASAADSNSVLVTGANSVWQNSKTLHLGGYRDGSNWVDGGTGNSLTVTNGGWVFVGDMAMNNLPNIGSGGAIAVGDASGNPELVAANGSAVKIAYGYVGLGSNETGSLILLDRDTELDVRNNLYVGYEGSSNSMEVSNGATARSYAGYIGYASGSDGNRISVSGAGSAWEIYGANAGYFYVGRGGISNRLSIADGGRVSGDRAFIGFFEGSDGNAVEVRGAGSVWNSREDMYVGLKGSSNVLTITSGGQVFSELGGIGSYETASDNLALVTGSGSVWSNRGNFYVGSAGSRNHLMIEDGGQVHNGVGFLGLSPSGSSNSVTVSGGGSVWNNRDDLYIGRASVGNSMMVADGGAVYNQAGYVGQFKDTDNGSVNIMGDGSLWHNREALYLGGRKSGTSWVDGGTGNSLVVSNGGWVQVGDVGTNNFPDGGNLGVVSVGGIGGAEMIIANGSSVESDLGYVGIDPTMSGSVTVTGAGSVWSNSVALFVGEGSDSSVSILAGGRVDSGMGLIGLTGDSSNNLVVVSGEGSEWKIPPIYFSGGSNIVYSDTRPEQDVFGSGQRTNSSPFDPVQSGLLSTMGGAPSSLDSPSGLSVGYMGSGNNLVISDGGRVDSVTSHIGYGATASRNSVLVSGAGSVWNAGNLNIGYNGSGNTLRIEGGGLVYAMNSSIGYGEGANGNSVVVSGENSTWSSGLHASLLISTQLIIITNYPPFTDFTLLTNSYPVYTADGAIVSSGSGIIGNNGSDGNVVVITDGSFAGTGYLPAGASTSNSISVTGGGAVFVGDNSLVLTNKLVVMTNLPPIQIEPILSIASMGELSVGRNGSDNSLWIEDGARVSNHHGIIGETSNAWNNAVSVVGTNSEWRSSGDLYMGGRMSQTYYMTSNVWENSWVDGGRGNSLYVADGGLVSVGRELHNRNYSMVSIDPGGHIAISSNYYQDATSVLRFGVETNAVGAPLNPFVSVGGTAEFEEGATLQYHSNVGVLDFDTFHTNLIVEANQLIIAGITNANAVDLQALNLDGSLVEVMLWEQDQDIYGLVGRRHLADSAGFTSGSQMALLSKEIDDLSLLGNSIAVGHINLLNGMSSAQQNTQLTQRYTQGTPTYRHRQGVLGGQKQVMAQTRAFQSASRSRAAKPEGAAGPHKAEQELRGWMRGYGSWASHDGTPRSFSGFDQNVYGTVVGLDKAYGNMLLGVAGGYARSDLTQDNNDSSDAKTGFGVLYSSFGSVDWFGDLNLSYGRSAIQTRSGTALGGEGDFDADNFSIYLGGGKEVRPEESSLLFTPEAALTIGYYGQESYNDGLMDVDAYDRWSFQSRLGAALAVEKQAGSVVLKPEARVYWLHEFNADPDRIGYSLIGGGGNYTFGIQAPDEDIFEVGVGFSATFSDRLELALDVDAQQSGLYHAVTVGARAMYEF